MPLGPSSTTSPLTDRPCFVSTVHVRYWSAIALLGKRIDSNRFSRLAFLPITDRSGPTAPPTPRTVWHFRHWVAPVRLAASSFLPLAASPLRAASTAIGGSFLGLSLPGAGNASIARL